VSALEEKHPSGADKIALYKWIVVDSPGMLLYVPKGDLHIDHDYQRGPRQSAVSALQSKWSWLACGVLTVAMRADGSLWVVDGQHRLLAARKRSDVQDLPCIVFPSESTQAEASGFVAANKNRKAMTSVSVFRALLVAGDPTANLVNDLLAGSGRTAAEYTSQTTVRCVGVLVRYAKEDIAALRRIWPAAIAVCRGHVLHERLIHALMHIETRMEQGDSLGHGKWRDRLEAIGYVGLQNAMSRFAATYARGGPRVYAVAVVDAINKGLRNRLVVRGVSVEADDA